VTVSEIVCHLGKEFSNFHWNLQATLNETYRVLTVRQSIHSSHLTSVMLRVNPLSLLEISVNQQPDPSGELSFDIWR
jgi:hypothetical protein